MPILSSASDTIDKLQSEVSRLKELVLDHEEAMRHLEAQQEVLESFCFALEKDHDVAARQLQAAKADQDDILANVKQGILTIGQNFLINPGYSRITEQLFGRLDLVGQPFDELFGDDPQLRSRLKRFLQTCFQARHASQEMLDQLNPVREHSLVSVGPHGEVVTKLFGFYFARVLQYDQYRLGVVAPIEKLMVVIDDRTAEYELNRELSRRTQEHAVEVEKAYRLITLPPDVVMTFMKEANELMGTLTEELDASTTSDVSLRIAHSLKGNARALGLDTVATAVHRLEDALAGDRATATAFRHGLGEALAQVRQEIQSGQQLFDRLLGVRDALRSTANDRALGIELTLQNLVQREAEHAGKSVELHYASALSHGLAPALIFRIKHSLVQLLRNAIAHGIESPAERARAQKTAMGAVHIRIELVEDSVVVVCRDDGRGIDIDQLRSVALKRGLISPESGALWSVADAHELMFQPGVTTQDHVSELAGRGVGLDVVRHHVEAVGGTVDVTSLLASHTEFTLRFPAISSATLDEG